MHLATLCEEDIRLFFYTPYIILCPLYILYVPRLKDDDIHIPEEPKYAVGLGEQVGEVRQLGGEQAGGVG
jgi:hypothetical protein